MWLNVSERLLLQDLLEHLMEMHFALEASFVHRQLTSLILTIFHMPDNPLHASFPLFFPQNCTLSESANFISLILPNAFPWLRIDNVMSFQEKVTFSHRLPPSCFLLHFPTEISYISWHSSCVYVFFIFHKTFASTDTCWLVICIACGLILILIYSYT